MNPVDFYNSSSFYESNDGLKLHFRDLGSKNSPHAIMCVPGLTRNSRDFEDLAPYLAENYRVICPDLRGRGLSDYDPNWKNYHPLTYTDDLWKLLNNLDISKVCIIGTSLGGLISMVMAFQDANRLSGVIMNDIGPEIDQQGLERIKKYAGLLPPVKNWDEAALQTKEVYGPWLKGLDESIWLKLAKRAYRTNADNQPVLDMDDNIGRAIKEVGEQKGNPWELFDGLKNTNILVLRGEISDILTDEILMKMKKRNPNIEYAVIPDRGHVPLLDEETSLTAINNFLKVSCQ